MHETPHRDADLGLAAIPHPAARWRRTALALLAGMGMVWFSASQVGPLTGALTAGLLCSLVVYRLERETVRRQTSEAQAQAIAQRERQGIALCQAQALRIRQARSHFLATADHELRQPLFAMTLYVSALKRHLGPEHAPLAANVKDCADSLNHLITDLLELSKLDAGVVPFHPQPFAIDALIKQVVLAHSPQAQLEGLRLVSRPSGLTADTDPDLLRRMLGKLISNALRYARQGGVLIACRRRQGKMWLEVWDTGVGIAPDQTEAIFEQFRQLDNHAPDVRQGSGLGLSIVAKMATLMGLQIRVRSRLAKGSLFAIELPLHVADSSLPTRSTSASGAR